MARRCTESKKLQQSCPNETASRASNHSTPTRRRADPSERVNSPARRGTGTRGRGRGDAQVQHERAFPSLRGFVEAPAIEMAAIDAVLVPERVGVRPYVHVPHACRHVLDRALDRRCDIATAPCRARQHDRRRHARASQPLDESPKSMRVIGARHSAARIRFALLPEDGRNGDPMRCECVEQVAKSRFECAWFRPVDDAARIHRQNDQLDVALRVVVEARGEPGPDAASRSCRTGQRVGNDIAAAVVPRGAVIRSTAGLAVIAGVRLTEHEQHSGRFVASRTGLLLFCTRPLDVV